MVQLIKKGGLRERANRSRTYQGSENTETTLRPNSYHDPKKQGSVHDKVMIDTDSITAKSVDPSKPD
ncbi:MAG: hypothetical protein KA474_08525 [Acinetobacter sp.]|nr:hypothetical protein [Acinetobacter sp.]